MSPSSETPVSSSLCFSQNATCYCYTAAEYTGDPEFRRMLAELSKAGGCTRQMKPVAQELEGTAELQKQC
jgi:hypothetical protein